MWMLGFAFSWVFTAKSSSAVVHGHWGSPACLQPHASCQAGMQGLPAAQQKRGSGSVGSSLPPCAFLLVSRAQTWVISPSEISLPVVRGCILRCSQYLKGFCFIQVCLLQVSGDRLHCTAEGSGCCAVKLSARGKPRQGFHVRVLLMCHVSHFITPSFSPLT